jgi:hypothetical protein
MLFVSLPLLAETGLRGVVIDAQSGQPVADATVMLDNQGITVSSGPNGDFSITNAKAGKDRLLIIGYGYKDWTQDVEITDNAMSDLGNIKITASTFNAVQDYNQSTNDMILTSSQLEDEEGNTQSVATLSGADDNPFFQAASYNFSLMRFRLRGYNNEYTQTYINGVNFNDASRGTFNYSMLGGLNQAFKNKTTGIGLDATSFAFGDIGGSNNINTFAKDYAPGFRGSVAYTNGSYLWRGMATYSTGLSKDGWALTLSAIGRYAKEGVIPGSFYRSWGYFMSLQKVINAQNSVSLTTFGAPTKRASNSATFQEAYDLAGDNLYNPNWGYQQGKKRNAKVVQSFDPTVILNWVWKPNMGTTLNTGAAFHKSFYSSSALNWYNARDPRPDYYRYMPSYYVGTDQSAVDFYTDLWENDKSFRQINWDGLYQTNLLNNYLADQTGVEKGSTYIVERRHSNQASWLFNSNLNTRLSDILTLQGGVGANYSVSSYYKTMKDLLGGRFWTDVDQFAERDFPGNSDILQNDMNNPNRKIYTGDRFGYDYDIKSFSTNLWLQNMINLPQWDLSYSAEVSYTEFKRDGNMRNGRAPENSYGNGKNHEFVNWGAKAGATYKIDGRNNIAAHVYYGTKAPEFNYAYVSPRIKDDVITDLKSGKILSGDISYSWSYHNFKGSITGFWTELRDQTERTSFYDDQYSTFMNYTLTGVHKRHKGIEIGAAFKLTPSVTVSAAANIARYQYKNRPLGTRSYENGSSPDTTQRVYLKNFYVSGTPQQAYSMSINWAAPHQLYLEINGTYMRDAYVDISPIRHEVFSNLWKMVNTQEELESKVKEISNQEELNDAFVLNMSIGKVFYFNSSSLNINLNLDNILNNTNIMTGGYQQGRFDYTNYSTTKFPNKYYYAQGFKLFLNLGVRF